MNSDHHSLGIIDRRTIDNGEMFRANARHIPVTPLSSTERRIIAWSLGLFLAVVLLAFERPTSVRTVVGLAAAAAVGWTLVSIKPAGSALERR